MADDELTVDEAATALGMHPGAVRKVILAGRLAARRIGQRLLLIPRAEVERYRTERLPPGRPRVPDDNTLRAQLPRLKALFSETERRLLVNAISGVRHSHPYVQELARNVETPIMGSFEANKGEVDGSALVEKVRLLTLDERYALVRACEWAWSRINKATGPGVPTPAQLFDQILETQDAPA